MNDLVIMKNKQAVTTSLEVADVFEKRHDHILRDIDKLKKDVPNFGEMFEESQEPDSYDRLRRVIYMNRDGFTLLAMGFTGDKALQFKLKYIEAFNKMEQMLKEQALPQTPEEKLALTMQVTSRLDKRVTNVEEKVDYLTNTSELNETQRYQLLQARKSKVIQACGGADSNYYREKKAKKVFSQFGRDFKKAFKIPRYDSLQKRYFDEAMKFTKNWYPDFVLQREIQNANAQTRLDVLQVTIMDDLQRGIYRMVVKEVARTQPKREENFLSKKDAEKLIKKYTKRYVLQEYLNATEAADVLDMSLTTFWRYRQKHPVPVYVIDGVKRYKKSELIKCVEDNSVRGYAQEDIMPDLGNTKLDHVLSYICKGFEMVLEFCAIAFVPLLIVEQLSIYGVTHADQVISLLVVLMLILSTFAVREIRKLRRRK